jgi:hypothetical protein
MAWLAPKLNCHNGATARQAPAFIAGFERFLLFWLEARPGPGCGDSRRVETRFSCGGGGCRLYSSRLRGRGGRPNAAWPASISPIEGRRPHQIVTMTRRSWGIFRCSQRYSACHVPRPNSPATTGIVSEFCVRTVRMCEGISSGPSASCSYAGSPSGARRAKKV